MSFGITLTSNFKRRLKPLLKRYSTIADDLVILRSELLNNPQVGEPLGRDCYKVRMRIRAKNSGKSGGARVITCVKIIDEQVYLITCVKIIDEQVYLLTVYDKSEQDSISDKERDELLAENGLM